MQPVIEATGEIFDKVQLDGIYLQNGHCCLIVYANSHVADFQWCPTENTAAWDVLLARIPAPTVVVIDGGSGALGRNEDSALSGASSTQRATVSDPPTTPPGKQLAS